MNTKFFKTNFDIVLYLLLATLISGCLALVFHLFSTNVVDISPIRNIGLLLEQIMSMSAIASLIIIGIEIRDRILNDSFANLCFSISQSFSLRLFLKQSEHSIVNWDLNNKAANHRDPILQNFNKAIQFSIVDIRKDTITVYIPIPKTQQSQRILYGMIEDIKQELGRNNPNYFFSPPALSDDLLIYRATKI